MLSNNRERKGFILLDLVAGIIIGMVLSMLVVVFFNTILFSQKTTQKIVQGSDYQSVFNQILYLAPLVNDVKADSNSVNLYLNNGCVVDVLYDSSKEEVSFKKECPSGKDVGIPPEGVKVTTFKTLETANGVELKLCWKDFCSVYFFKKKVEEE